MKKTGKITHNCLITYTHTHVCTQTPLSFNDAMRAWKGNTVGISWVWKKHFFLLWQTKSGMCYEEDEEETACISSFFFYPSSLLALLSAVLTARQVQRAQEPSLLQTKKPSERGRVLPKPITGQSWPDSGCLPINVSYRAFTLSYNILK